VEDSNVAGDVHSWEDVDSSRDIPVLSKDETNFLAALPSIHEAASLGSDLDELDVVWDHVSLFGRLPKRLVRYAVNRLVEQLIPDLQWSASTLIPRREFQSVNMAWWQAVNLARARFPSRIFPSIFDLQVSGGYLSSMNPWVRYAVIKYCSRWYPLLSRGAKKRVFNLCGDDKGLRYLQEACATADGIVFSLYVSVPVDDSDWDSMWSIIKSILTQCLFRPDFGVILRNYKKTSP
jgi:hypothetical protein